MFLSRLMNLNVKLIQIVMANLLILAEIIMSQKKTLGTKAAKLKIIIPLYF
jgi:hypothetical protein